MVYSKKLNENKLSNKERMLVCISPSPSCEKVIIKAIDLAKKSGSQLIALYVSSLSKEELNEVNKTQLKRNIELVEQGGAKIETIYAGDIPFQIIEYAKSKHVSKIIIGRSVEKRIGIFKKMSLIDQLLSLSNEFDIYVIPVYDKYSISLRKEDFYLSKKKVILSLLILFFCTMISFVFFLFNFNDSNIIMTYILGIFLISFITANKIYCIVFSLICVLIFNFFFTFPTLSLSVYDSGYLITFLIMFIVAFMVSGLSSRIQQNSQISSKIAQRTKILLETNQILQKEMSKEGIIQKGCEQLYKLLNRDIIYYTFENNELNLSFLYPNQNKSILLQEIEVAKWVATHNKRAGASTHHFSNAKFFYLAIRANNVSGVVGIYLGKDRLDIFENDILLAILGEIALALEIEKVIFEKNEADLKAKNEQLRADLLRSISHDLRTPLTSISGNADMLISNSEVLSKDQKHKLYMDIYDDAFWLINLVENLLSVTKIENGTMQIKKEPQVVEDVILEALNHVSRKKIEHTIHVQLDNELVMANIDARLIIQVIINIVDNAIKYTPKDSNITIHAYQKNEQIIIDIYDDGYGIDEKEQEKIFEKFYLANNKIKDSQRGLGLGLALCKAIVEAHGGIIKVSNCKPHGALFQFTLPAVILDLKDQAMFDFE